MDLQTYLNLIPSANRRRPRFMATAEALLRPLCRLETVLSDLRLAFDPDTAEGALLDAVGVRVGISRKLHAPLAGVYFALDTEGIGLDEGFWLGAFDPGTGLVSLPDDLYRLMIRAKIAANAWDGTAPGAYDAWEGGFSGTGSTILIQDYQDMSIGIGIAGIRLNPVLEQLLLQGYIPLKPEGVRVSWYAVSDSEGPLFGLDAENASIAGLDTGSFGRELVPLR